MRHRPFERLSAALLVAVAICFSATAKAQFPQASDEHQQLAHEVGTWDATTKMWPTPDAQPIPGKAVETNTMLGKLWIVSEFKGDMMGMAYVGRGQYGFDPIKKKYVGTWIDSMSPHLSIMAGTLDDGTLTMMSKGIDAATGKEQTTKMVSTYEDDDHRTFTMFAPHPEKKGEWWKMLEVKYTRRK